MRAKNGWIISPLLAFLGLASLGGLLVGCGPGRQPAHEGELPAGEASNSVVVASVPPAETPAPQGSAKAEERAADAEGKAEESEADASDYPDEPEDGQGELRDLGRKTAKGEACQLRVGPVDPSLDALVRDWIGTRETSAARDAAALCGSNFVLGPVTAGFACRARRRRPKVLIVACYTFPNIMGNANPFRSHAVFDLTGPKRLGVGDMFLNKSATCKDVGVALADRGPQLHDRSPAAWAERCRVSPQTPVADSTISIVGPNLTFDVSGEFLAWGNAPDPVVIPIADLRQVLRPRFAALLGR